MPEPFTADDLESAVQTLERIGAGTTLETVGVFMDPVEAQQWAERRTMRPLAKKGFATWGEVAGFLTMGVCIGIIAERDRAARAAA